MRILPSITPLFLSLVALLGGAPPSKSSQFSFPNIDAVYGPLRAGYGVNPNAADPGDIILGLGVKPSLTSGPGSSTTFDFKAETVREFSDVFTSRSLSAEAQGRYLMYRARASFEIDTASHKTTDSIMWRVIADRDYGVREQLDLSRVELTDVARDRLNQNYDAFVKQYGTHFISSWRRKAHFAVYFEAYNLTQEDQRHVDVMIEASARYVAGDASARLKMGESFRSLSSSARTRVSFTADGMDVGPYFVGMTSLTSLDQIQEGTIRLLADMDKSLGNVAQYFTTPYADVIAGFPLLPPYPEFPELKKAQTAFEHASVIRLQAENYKKGPRSVHLESEELDYLDRKVTECEERLAEIDFWLKQFNTDPTLKVRPWVRIDLKLPELKWHAAKMFQAVGPRGHAATVFAVLLTGGNEVGAVLFRSVSGPNSVLERRVSLSEEAIWPSPTALQYIFDAPHKMNQARDTNGSRRRWLLWYDQWTPWANIQKFADSHVAWLLDKAGNIISYGRDQDGRYVSQQVHVGKAVEPYPGPSGDVHYKILLASTDLTPYQQIKEPIDGARYINGQTINLEAWWFPALRGGSAKLTFLIDGMDVSGAVAPAPDSTEADQKYRYSIRNITPGTHTLDIAPAENDPVSFRLAPISFTVEAPVVSPTITLLPAQPNATPTSGSKVVLSANVTGTEPLIYSWHRNGLELFDNARIEGSGSRTLTIVSLTNQDTGSYTLKVRNSAGAVLSSPFRLDTVLPRIIVTPSPIEGGSVSNVEPTPGSNVATLIAKPSVGYVFKNWTEGGQPVATINPLTLPLDRHRELVANFEKPSITNGVQVQLRSIKAPPGSTVAIPVAFERGPGNVNAMGFSISFPTAQAAFSQVALGSSLPAGTSILVNDTQATQGRVGVVLILPTGQTISAGSAHVATVTLTLSTGLTTGTIIEIPFTNDPALLSVSDTLGNDVSTSWANGSITIGDPGLEADVRPRHSGDGALTAADVTILSRMVAGLDSALTESEFQRADCAPIATLGNALITAADVTVAARYVAGLEPKTHAGGPTGPGGRQSLAHRSRLSAPSTPTQISLGSVVASPAGPVALSLHLSARGTENALSFSIRFDPMKIAYASASLGTSATGASLVENASQSGSGRVAFVILMPAGQSFIEGTFELLRLSFTAGAAPGRIQIDFTDIPAPQSASDALGEELPVQFVGGAVTIVAGGDKPTILSHPVNTTVSKGGVAVFSVSATGGESFQWRFNGAEIPGANSPTLTLSNLTSESVGLYAVTITNQTGSVTSTPAVLGLFGEVALYLGMHLSGPVGTRFRVDYTEDLNETAQWRELTTILLTSSPYLVVDPEASWRPQRYYRAAIVP